MFTLFLSSASALVTDQRSLTCGATTRFLDSAEIDSCSHLCSVWCTKNSTVSEGNFSFDDKVWGMAYALFIHENEIRSLFHLSLSSLKLVLCLFLKNFKINFEEASLLQGLLQCKFQIF